MEKCAVWSVDNGTLLNQNDLELDRAGRRGGRRSPIAIRARADLQNAVFPSDGCILVADAGTFRVLSVESGRELRNFQSGETMGLKMAISPDGKLLLSNSMADVSIRRENFVFGTFPTEKKSGVKICPLATMRANRLLFRQMESDLQQPLGATHGRFDYATWRRTEHQGPCQPMVIIPGA